MNLETLTKRERSRMPKKVPTLKRIKIGKALFTYASLPLFSWWAYGLAIPMMITIRPTLWAIDKLKIFNGSISEPMLWTKGRLNERKGNGDLQWSL